MDDSETATHLTPLQALQRHLAASPYTGYAIELFIVTIWGIYVGRAYLNLDEDVIGVGFDYGITMAPKFFWDQVERCGTCALWNGMQNGGAPAMADTLSDTFHPIAALPSLVFGTLNGAKIAIVLGLILGGIGQWWLGFEIGVSRYARVWTSCLAISAGHLLGRLESGIGPMITSTAAATLVLASVFRLSRNPSNRNAAFFAITLAGLAVAGQGYVQASMIAVLPCALILPGYFGVDLREFFRKALLGIGISLFLAAPFLVPLVHFLPHLSKEIDTSFSRQQPLQYLILSLIIGDYDYYHSELLNKNPYPSWYSNYIGWFACILALIGIVAMWKLRQRIAVFLLLVVGISFWLGSGRVFPWLYEQAEGFPKLHEFFASFRAESLMTSVGVVAVLALAAAGLDYAVFSLRPGNFDRRRITCEGADCGKYLAFPVLIIVALVSLWNVTSFNRSITGVVPIDTEDRNQVISKMSTSSDQWVMGPWSETQWITWASNADLKLTNSYRTWHWRGRQMPPAYKEVTRPEWEPMKEGMTHTTDFGNLKLWSSVPPSEYASVEHADGTRTLCAATGSGGDIDVSCNLSQAGLLTVVENEWSGWKVEVNNSDADVETNGQWLGVQVPAGDVVIEFRYRPWDVPLGIALMVVGLLAAIWCIARPGTPPAVTTPAELALHLALPEVSSAPRSSPELADSHEFTPFDP